MRYPSPAVIAKADQKQCLHWLDNLPDPGVNYYGSEDFNEMLEFECDLLDLINKRLKELGIPAPANVKIII